MYSIFDLDNTVICSKHRQSCHADGTLDLDHWIENSTAKKVAKDTLLPCAELMRNAWNIGHIIVVCTSRVMGTADLEFMGNHRLYYTHMLSRPNGCSMSDPDLKDIQFRLFAQSQNISWVRFCETSIFFEDSKPILDRMKSIGVDCTDANEWNFHLKRANG